MRRFCMAFVLLSSIAAPGVEAAGERLAFVTSVQGTGNLQTWPAANGLSGVAAADAICQTRASSAGLPEANLFVAWVSDGNNDAYCRVHGLTGKRANACGQPILPATAGPWWRLDGRPFADAAPTSLNGDHILNPLNVTELNTVSNALTAFTATSPIGEKDTDFAGCGDWTSASSSAFVAGGRIASTARAWSVGRIVSCNTPTPLYCLQRGTGPALPKFSTRGRVAFLTAHAYSGNLGASPAAQGQTGLAAGDAICRSEAQASSLPRPTTYRAWLSDIGVPAASRFVNDGAWYRLDGQRIAGSLAKLQSGMIESPINLDNDGQYIQSLAAWTGTTASGAPASDNCSGWTNSAAAAGYGVVNTTLAPWTQEADTLSCASQQRIYCLADNDTVFADTF